MNDIVDLIIVGGGPAGAAAAVYAARKTLKTIMITDSFAGQSSVSTDIQNWIGVVSIPGPTLAENLEQHARAYAGQYLEIKTGERVEKIESMGTDNAPLFAVTTDAGATYKTKTVLVTAGSSRRKLDVPGADTFEHKGLTYCATCDGPLFAGKDCVVVGGGNAGFESAAQLLAYAKSVTLLQYNDQIKADPSTVQKVTSNPKMKLILNAETAEVKGDAFAKTLVYKDKTTGNLIEIPAEGVFVEIGSVPNTNFVDGIVTLDQYKRIVVDPRTQRASKIGIWAAGDCTDGLYHQNNIAAGDAIKALENIYFFLHAE